jgi:pilus assembly protein Flp/PilA
MMFEPEYLNLPKEPVRPMEAHMVHKLFALLVALLADEAGQGLVEYALIIALVAVGLIAILLVLRNSIGNVFKNAASQLNNATVAPYAP